MDVDAKLPVGVLTDAVAVAIAAAMADAKLPAVAPTVDATADVQLTTATHLLQLHRLRL